MWTSYGDAQDYGGPIPRQGHALAAYRGVLYCMGGKGKLPECVDAVMRAYASIHTV